MTSNYFEPSAAPEEAILKKKAPKKIKVRFKTKEDVFAFEKKTGISLTHKKNVSIIYPIKDVFSLLDD